MKFEIKDSQKADLVRSYLGESKIEYEEKKRAIRKKMTPEEKKAKKDARTPEQIQKIAERVKKMQDARKLKKLNSTVPPLPDVKVEATKVEETIPVVKQLIKKVRKPRKQTAKKITA